MDPRTQVAICKVCSSSTTKVLSKPDHQNLSLEGGFIVPPIEILQQTEHVSDSLPEGQRWRDEVYEGRNAGLPSPIPSVSNPWGSCDDRSVT